MSKVQVLEIIIQVMGSLVAAFLGAYYAQKGKIRTKLHESVREQQIEALRDLYAKLIYLMNSTQQLSFHSADKDIEPLIKDFGTLYFDALKTFVTYNLFFPNNLKEQINEFFSEVKNAKMELDSARELQCAQVNLRPFLEKANEIASKNLPNLLKEIQEIAKKILKSEQIEL